MPAEAVGTNVDIYSKLDFALTYFRSEEYTILRGELQEAMTMGDSEQVENTLDKFPTVQQLTDKLIEKLKDKSVYKTLSKILEGKKLDKYSYIKCLGSLMAHAAIECDYGHIEYMAVVIDIYEKLGKILF